MAQGAVAMIGGNMVNVMELDWPQIIGCVATMGIISVLTSVAGLPEVDKVEILPVHYDDEVNADDVDEVKEADVHE
jgi:hypothetical protein